jgi:hypothetical protein
MLVPPIARRREIDRKLTAYFQNYRPATFQRAISDFCNFYGVRKPRVEWYEYIDWGRTAGRTFEDGRMHLVHPENWKRCRVYKSERMWIQTVYHELAHYVFWTDAERKAEAFTLRMVRGLKRPLRRGRSSASRPSRSVSERQSSPTGGRVRRPPSGGNVRSHKSRSAAGKRSRGENGSRQSAARRHPALAAPRRRRAAVSRRRA